MLTARNGRVWVAAVAGSLLISQAAGAATFTVTTAHDGGIGSLREAITSANSLSGDDTIYFNLPNITLPVITLNSALPNITSNIAIINDRVGDSPISIQRSSLAGTPSFRIFHITPGHTVSITGLTLSNGTGGVSNYGSTLTMRNCTVQRNTSFSGTGGGIDNVSSAGDPPAILTLRNCTVSENTANEGASVGWSGGGGLRNIAFGNDTEQAGKASATLIDCIVRQNSVSGFATVGAGIFNVGFTGGVATLTVTRCNIRENNATGVQNSVVGNAPTAASVTMLNSTVRDNDGPGLGNSGSATSASMNLENCTLSGNQSSGSGGALYNSGSLRLTNCTLSGNTAGGGAYNAADRGGGALYNSAGTATLLNCTFAGNFVSADGQGQSIMNKTGARVTTTNSLFVRNGLKLNFSNSGTFTSRGHNLSNDAAGGNGTTLPGGLLNGTRDIRNTNPMINALANNGGPTETRSLQAFSPAIDAGDDAVAPSRDQRGYARSGRSDIGAYEFGGVQ